MSFATGVLWRLATCAKKDKTQIRKDKALLCTGVSIDRKMTESHSEDWVSEQYAGALRPTADLTTLVRVRRDGDSL